MPPTPLSSALIDTGPCGADISHHGIESAISETLLPSAVVGPHDGVSPLVDWNPRWMQSRLISGDRGKYDAPVEIICGRPTILLPKAGAPLWGLAFYRTAGPVLDGDRTSLAVLGVTVSL